GRREFGASQSPRCRAEADWSRSKTENLALAFADPRPGPARGISPGADALELPRLQFVRPPEVFRAIVRAVNPLAPANVAAKPTIRRRPEDSSGQCRRGRASMRVLRWPLAEESG